MYHFERGREGGKGEKGLDYVSTIISLFLTSRDRLSLQRKEDGIDNTSENTTLAEDDRRGRKSRDFVSLCPRQGWVVSFTNIINGFGSISGGRTPLSHISTQDGDTGTTGEEETEERTLSPTPLTRTSPVVREDDTGEGSHGRRERGLVHRDRVLNRGSRYDSVVRYTRGWNKGSDMEPSASTKVVLGFYRQLPRTRRRVVIDLSVRLPSPRGFILWTPDRSGPKPGLPKLT